MKIKDQHGVLVIWRACLSPTHLLHHILDSCKELTFLLFLFLEIKWHLENSEIKKWKSWHLERNALKSSFSGTPDLPVIMHHASVLCLLSASLVWSLEPRGWMGRSLWSLLLWHPVGIFHWCDIWCMLLRNMETEKPLLMLTAPFELFRVHLYIRIVLPRIFLCTEPEKGTQCCLV